MKTAEISASSVRDDHSATPAKPTLAEITARVAEIRAELEAANESDRAAIKQAYARIKERNATIATLPREPVKRKSKNAKVAT